MNIKKDLAKIVWILIVGCFVALPIFSFAAQSGSNTVNYTAPPLWPTGFWGPLVWCTGSSLQVANPTPSPTPGTAGQTPPTCNNLCDLIGTFINIIYLAISIAIFIAAPLMVAVGGIMIMFSGANPGMLETGKKVLTGAVIGVAIVLCSYLIVNTVLWALNITSIGGFNGNSLSCSIAP